MKSSNMVATAILGLVASVNAQVDIKSIDDCQGNYGRLMLDLSLTIEQKCEALVTFSRCLGEFPTDDAMEAMLFRANDKLCAPFWDEVERPAVKVARDNMQFSVDNEKQIEFNRNRRASISVFTMNDKIADLLETVEDLQKQLMDEKQESKDEAAETAQDLRTLESKLSDAVEAAKESLEDSVDDLSDKVDQSNIATTAAVNKAKSDTTAALNKAKSDTDAALDKSKKDAATASAALEKKISGSVTDKLKSFEGTEVALTSLKKSYHGNPKIPVYRVAKFKTHHGNFGWFDGNDAQGFGGIHPSQWTDGNYRCDQMNADVKYLQRLFTQKETANKYGANICSEGYDQRTSTTGLVCGALFRIKNTGTSTIRWSPAITMTSWHGWAESASISVNGNNLIGAKDCNHMCRFTPSLDIPANSQKDRISTAIFASTSSYANGHYNQWRATLLLFRDNSLALPNGLEFVEDLDTMTGSWKQ